MEEISNPEVIPIADRQLTSLSPLSIVRQSAKLSTAKIGGALVMLPVTLVVARFLGPRLMGVVGLVTLWQLYANLLKPSMFSAAFREMPGLLAKGDTDEVRRLQNVGITSEATYLVLPLAAFIIGALVQSDPLQRNALLLGAAAFALLQINYFADGIQWAHQRYGLIARASLGGVLAAAAFALITIQWLGVYAALAIPAVTAITAVVIYGIFAPPFDFKLRWDRVEAKRLLRVGIPLALGTIFYWAFRTTDRTVVASLMPLTALGYLSFSMQFIDAGIKLVSDFQNVVSMRVWSRLDKHSEPLGPSARRLSLIVLVVTCMGINLAQSLFGAFVKVIAPAFAFAVPVFEVLAILLTAGTAGMVSLTILNSPRVNKQKLTSVIYGLGVVVNAVLVLASIRLGYGLIGVAVSTVVAQTLVAATLIAAAHTQIFSEDERWLPYYSVLLGIYLLSVAVDVAFHTDALRLGEGNHVFVASALRAVVSLCVWVPVFAVFARLRWPAVVMTSRPKAPARAS